MCLSTIADAIAKRQESLYDGDASAVPRQTHPGMDPSRYVAVLPRPCHMYVVRASCSVPIGALNPAQGVAHAAFAGAVNVYCKKYHVDVSGDETMAGLDCAVSHVPNASR